MSDATSSSQYIGSAVKGAVSRAAESIQEGVGDARESAEGAMSDAQKVMLLPDIASAIVDRIQPVRAAVSDAQGVKPART